MRLNSSSATSRMQIKIHIPVSSQSLIRISEDPIHSQNNVKPDYSRMTVHHRPQDTAD